jgi:hypothetical protein
MASTARSSTGRGRLGVAVATALALTALTAATATAAPPPPEARVATAVPTPGAASPVTAGTRPGSPDPELLQERVRSVPAGSSGGLVFRAGRSGRGVYTRLRAVAGAAVTTHLGINNRGQITGGFYDAVGRPHGFLGTEAATAPLTAPAVAATSGPASTTAARSSCRPPAAPVCCPSPADPPGRPRRPAWPGLPLMPINDSLFHNGLMTSRSVVRSAVGTEAGHTGASSMMPMVTGAGGGCMGRGSRR